MLAIALVLNTLGIGLFCWAIFTLAVYALPFFVALSIGMLAFHGGAGGVGALLIGLASGAFAVPAAIAGYHVTFALSKIGVSSLAWREAFACLGGVCIGGTAWMRLTVFAETRPLESAGVAENMPRPVLTAATYER